MRPRFILISAAIFAAVCTTAYFSFIYANTNTTAHSTQNNHALQASLKGLNPGTEVSYEVVSLEGKIINGKNSITASGKLEIPAYDLSQMPANSPVQYNLEIGTGSTPLTVRMKFDPVTKNISISGQGLEKFSDIEVQSGAQVLKTKTDWSGLFRDLNLRSADAGNNGNFKLAMYNNVIGDQAARNPLVIDVYSAPGGGGPTGSSVNTYSTPFCDSPNLSICYSGVVDQAIDDTVHFIPEALMAMTGQFSAIMMQQVAIIGKFLDAKMQMETQRDLQRLHAEAVKDYHPSDQMCRFGSFIKSIAHTEEKTNLDKRALSDILARESSAQGNLSTSYGYGLDIMTRIRQFRRAYCDPADLNNGLAYLCEHDQDGTLTLGEPIGAWDAGVPDGQRMNKDIDYARTVDMPLTLDINFTDTNITKEEEDVIALARNLYWPKAMEIVATKDVLPSKFNDYMNSRQIFAINNVAQNSFSQIVAMKGNSETTLNPEGGPAFMKSMMREFGLTDPEIDDILGANPSYYAQMEVLTKKIYQTPDFYTNLYDKPVNVDRIGASMDAIKLMQGRDQFEASLRREMLLSMMVEQELANKFKNINDNISASNR